MEKINKILGKILKNRGIKKKIREEMSLLIWAEAAGPKVSSMTEVSHIKNGFLFVKVANSMWSQQLSFLKHTLINKINHNLGSQVVKDIKFIMGFKEREIIIKDVKNNPEFKNYFLTVEEIENIEKITETIKEEKFREKFKNILIKEAKAAKWKKEMGWAKCSECKVLFLPRKKEVKCPLCTLKKE